MNKPLQAYVDDAQRAGHVGIAAGVVVNDEVAYAGAGVIGGSGRQPDERTLFRIASLSKVFTGVALATRLGLGELHLSDPVRTHLPAWVPPSGVDPIRLEHLATHRSGLPRGLDGADPYVSAEEYGRAISRVRLNAPPGTEYAYSNLQVIGMVLTEAGTRSVDRMLRETVTGDLGLSDIVAEPTAAQLSRGTTGHDVSGAPCRTPTYPHGVASGGLYGTVSDLVAFLRAYWDRATPRETAAAMALAARPRSAAFADNEVGLFWHVGAVPDGGGVRVVWHNGGLPGYRSFLGFVPERRIGVAVLTNTARSVDGLGAALLAEAGAYKTSTTPSGPTA